MANTNTIRKNPSGKENRVEIYPVPDGAARQRDYILKVRPLGEEQWQEVDCYRVKVDMHDVRAASMAMLDFQGAIEVEITFPRFYSLYKVDIRPLTLGILPKVEEKRVTFVLEHPADLSIECNEERFHNLHLFAGAIEEKPDKAGENVLVVKGSQGIGDGINETVSRMPEGRLVYIEAGFHYVGEFLWHLPSHTRIYLEGGAVLKGALVCDHAEDIHIFGKGVLYLADYDRFSAVNGLRLSHSRDLTVENLVFINPPHYTIHMGDCEDVRVRNVKSFSCEGWSDGIDMMNCRNVLIDGGFLRTSDDCIAIYGSRWDNRGDSRNITVRNLSVWADVAHPLMIGTHGAHEEDGDIIENILFENIDILEHHEFQAGYLGAMCINAGDKNTIRNVVYRKIRIEPFAHGKVLDFQVKWNKDYNPAPGRLITGIRLEQIHVMSGHGEEVSCICGYDEDHRVEDIVIDGFFRDGVRTESLEQANIRVGAFFRMDSPFYSAKHDHVFTQDNVNVLGDQTWVWVGLSGTDTVERPAAMTYSTLSEYESKVKTALETNPDEEYGFYVIEDAQRNKEEGAVICDMATNNWLVVPRRRMQSCISLTGCSAIRRHMTCLNWVSKGKTGKQWERTASGNWTLMKILHIPCRPTPLHRTLLTSGSASLSAGIRRSRHALITCTIPLLMN